MTTSFKPLKLDIRRRYDLTVLVIIVVVSLLLIGTLYRVVAGYANDYSIRYWMQHTQTFTESLRYPVIMSSASGADNLVRTFATDRNVMHTSVFNGLGLLASSGHAPECQRTQSEIKDSFVVETNDIWCIFAPVTQGSESVGHVELAISKADYNDILSKILSASAFIIPTFTGLIFFLIRRSSRLLTLTLIDMSTALNKVTQGLRGTRFNFSGTSEINTMRDVLNNLLSKIEQNEQALEQLVENRTLELKKALENSQTANIYKGQIMAIVTHEMKTPLHAVMSGLHLLYEQLPKGPGYELGHECHARAINRANELNQYIDNILLHAKLEADKYLVSLEAVNLKSLFQGCADKVTFLRERNRNRLHMEGTDISIVCDPVILGHVGNNLLSNACKFTQDGDITLTWSLQHKTLVIEVRDTGCGIARDSQAIIFDAFRQADMSLSRKYGGIGLGLAIVQQFVHLLNGSIHIESKEGLGTKFTVKIPNSAG